MTQNKISDFLLKVIDTEEFKGIEYFIFSIRKQYLNFMTKSRLNNFEVPTYLVPLVDKVIELFNESGISTVDMLQYMLDNDINNWIHYYSYTFIIPMAQGKRFEMVDNLNNLYAHVMTGYILDVFGFNRLVDCKLIS